MSSFYGWLNVETQEYRQKYSVSRGNRPCVFLTESGALTQLTKWQRIGKYTKYEVAKITGRVEE